MQLKTLGLVAMLSFLPACLVNPFGGSTPVPAPVVNPLVHEIIADAQKVCEFVPSVESVVSILSVAPGVTIANTIVTAICDGLQAYEANLPSQLAAAHAANKAVTFHMFLNGKHVTVSGNKL